MEKQNVPNHQPAMNNTYYKNTVDGQAVLHQLESIGHYETL